MTTTPSDEGPAGNLALASDARPGVTSVNPASGTDGGGDMVTISGINLTDATSVRFGGQDALVYKVLADNTITAQTPRAIDGQLLVEVTVSTPIGTWQSSTASTFAYIAAARAWRPIHTLALVAIVVAMVILSVAIPGSSGFTPGVAREWSWIAALVLLALFIMVAGQGITDRWEGLFIDERNKITLSRLQLVLWVVLIVSAFFALALDMSKIQKFFFTIVLVAAYAAALFGMFASGERALHALPGLDSSMVALLAISHGAYLTNKVVPNSQTQMQ